MVKSVMTAISVMGTIGRAHADDKWTGLYAGVDAGVVFNHVQLKSQQLGFTDPSGTCNTSSNFSTFSPGLQLGYMRQFLESFVAGLEANIAFNTNQENTLNCNCDINSDVYDHFAFKNPKQAALKGRVGWALSSFLPYLTAGVSLSDVRLKYENEGGDSYSNNAAKAGWLIGGGLEWAFGQRWSLRTEYYYAGYGENTVTLQIPSVYGLQDPDGNSHVSLNSNNIVVSLNYWIAK